MKTTLIARLVLTFCVICPFAKEDSAQTTKKDSRPVEFVDITNAAGIKWGITTLASGARYLIETMGGGGGFIDYNGDGLLDIYFVCYSQTPQPDPNAKLKDILYRNNGDGT